MNYELAKELKEAGFPQNDTWDGSLFLCQHSQPKSRDEAAAHILVADKCKLAKVPTLSELIEACGIRFWRITFVDTSMEWTAEASFPSLEIGKTPEEAVARLWLALNKK